MENLQCLPHYTMRPLDPWHWLLPQQAALWHMYKSKPF